MHFIGTEWEWLDKIKKRCKYFLFTRIFMDLLFVLRERRAEGVKNVQSNLRFSKVYEDQINHFSEEQIEELYPKLRKYCQFISQNKWDGEDLVQDSLLKAWDHYRYNQGISSALLNKMAHNKWVDTTRKRRKEVIETIPDSEAPYNETELSNVRFDVIQRLLAELTPKQTIIFTLKEAFQFQSQEIAELLHTTETAIKSALFRAKHRLNNRDSAGIEQYWEDVDKEYFSYLLQEALTSQDPTILIRGISSIPALQKDTKSPKCSMHKLRPSLSPSSMIYMAA
jgi:RNA polymerase sigma-70 factor (ECF subfamily)